MPVNLTYTEPAEWPSHLPPPGSGAPSDKPWADQRRRARKEALDRYAAEMRAKRTPSTRVSSPVAASPRREAPKAELERAVELGREMEAILLAEAMNARGKP